jgi:hypothetical protein
MQWFEEIKRTLDWVARLEMGRELGDWALWLVSLG